MTDEGAFGFFGVGSHVISVPEPTTMDDDRAVESHSLLRSKLLSIPMTWSKMTFSMFNVVIIDNKMTDVTPLLLFIVTAALSRRAAHTLVEVPYLRSVSS